jgi:hypothetical protein
MRLPAGGLGGGGPASDVSQQNEKGAVDQGLVAADGDVGADLEVGPAQFVLDLLAALPGPVPDPVDPHDLGQARRRVRAAYLPATSLDPTDYR